MASIFQRFSFSNASGSPADNPTDAVINAGRIYGARDYKRSMSQSQSSYANSSPLAKTYAKIFGARDYRHSIDQSTQSSRRASIIDDYTANPDVESDTDSNKVVRKYSIPYGPRHYAIAMRERGGSI